MHVCIYYYVVTTKVMIKDTFTGTRETAQRLRVITALAEDLSSGPCTLAGYSRLDILSSLQIFALMYTPTHRHAHIYNVI